jgi:hypothetical protein
MTALSMHWAYVMDKKREHHMSSLLKFETEQGTKG